MSKKAVVTVTVTVGLWGLLLFPAGGENFRFKYREGDTYRILSTIAEDVFVDGIFFNHADIVNRIAVAVTAAEDTRGRLEATFMTTERYTKTPVGTGGNPLSSLSPAGDTPEAFTWGREYDSVYTCDELGHFVILDRYFMPVVRDVPVFPRRDVKVGETWEAPGKEAQDLRQSFGVPRPFQVPFDARYRYRGTETLPEGRLLHVIEISYDLDWTTPKSPTGAAPTGEVPVKTKGETREVVYWDNERGMIHHYAEEFRIEITTNAGKSYLFTGTAQAEVTDYSPGRDADVTLETIEAELQAAIDAEGLADLQVTATDKGLTITIPDITFQADSGALTDDARHILDRIAPILAAHPGRDLLVTGHTARAGSEAAQMRLSEERATAVAGYLLSLGVRDQAQVFTQWFGSTKPLGSNTSEEGRARNRRVEITLLQ
jgi:outer membrane protein OmpA-like peptidoglycan-associated protein